MDFCEIGADLWFRNRMIMKHTFQVAPLTPLTPILGKGGVRGDT